MQVVLVTNSCTFEVYVFVNGLHEVFLGNKKSAYFKINRASELYGEVENKYKELKMCCNLVYLPTQLFVLTSENIICNLCFLPSAKSLVACKEKLGSKRRKMNIVALGNRSNYI